MEGISKIAEQCWLLATGGSIDSEPTLQEVQNITDYVAGYMVKQDWYEKFKADNQHESSSCYLLRFQNLTLTDYDAYTKVVSMPENIIDLPRDRGLDAVTYGGPPKRIEIWTASQLIGSSKLREFTANYYAVWNGPQIFIYDKCENKKPQIATINLIVAVANDTTLPNAMNFLIMNEVLKRIQSTPVFPDMRNDQNNAR